MIVIDKDIPQKIYLGFDMPEVCDDCPLYLREFSRCGIFPTSRWGANDETIEEWMADVDNVHRDYPVKRPKLCGLKEFKKENKE